MIDALAEPNPEGLATVAHNEFGGFSARGWLKYLNGHAKSEAKMIK